MTTTTPIFGFTRPSSDDYAHLLGDDMGATVDRLEAVLYGMGVRVSPDATALAAEIVARQALSPGAWQTPVVVGAGLTPAGYSPARYRKLPAVDSVQLVMVVNGPITAGQILFTLPLGYRPPSHVTIPSLTGPAAMGQLDVQSSGQVRCQSAVAAGGFLGFAAMVPLS